MHHSMQGQRRELAGNQEMTKYLWQSLFVALMIVAIWLALFGWRLPEWPDPTAREHQTPPTVLGNSMAPTLFGAHQKSLCPDCNHLNRFANESFPASLYYCGRCRKKLEKPTFESETGDDVQVQPANELKRWDIVLVRDPGEKMRIIKRLVGFPGETLQIKLGDLWINGRRIERTLDEILNTRITLHEDTSPKTSFNIPAPDAALPTIGWYSTPSTLAVEEQTQTAQERLSFLYREPWSITPNGQANQQAAGAIVSDWYPENPAFSGPLWPVTDQILELCFVPKASGELKVSLRDAHSAEPACIQLEEWKSKWEASRWSDDRSERSLPETNFALQYVFAHCDGAYWMRVNTGSLDPQSQLFQKQETLTEWRKSEVEIDSPSSSAVSPETLWLLEFSGIDYWVTRYVARDLYFRGDSWSEGRGIPVIRTLEGYFLLGDNQPISLDSRQKQGWENGVPKDWIEGRITPQN